MYRQAVGWTFFGLLVSSSVLSTLAHPNSQGPPGYYRTVRGVQRQQQVQQGQPLNQQPAQPLEQQSERKLAAKSNAIKKVALDDLDDVQTNQISDSSSAGGFSWSNLLGTSNIIPSVAGMLMQMIFNPGGGAVGPNKSEGLDEGGTIAPSPWANLLSVGMVAFGPALYYFYNHDSTFKNTLDGLSEHFGSLKILTAFLGGTAPPQGDGIDKVDNGAGGSPLQGILAAVVSTMVGGRDPQQVNMLAKQAGEFINIVVNLLDALKTSFSHRSMAARNLGRKDSISDASVAGIAMMKGYVRSLGTDENSCMAKYMCQANNECSTDIGQSSLFCHLGSYAASFILDKSSAATTFDMLYEAGRRGRSGDNCQQAYLECNEV